MIPAVELEAEMELATQQPSVPAEVEPMLEAVPTALVSVAHVRKKSAF